MDEIGSASTCRHRAMFGVIRGHRRLIEIEIFIKEDFLIIGATIVPVPIIVMHKGYWVLIGGFDASQ